MYRKRISIILCATKMTPTTNVLGRVVANLIAYTTYHYNNIMYISIIIIIHHARREKKTLGTYIILYYTRNDIVNITYV